MRYALFYYLAEKQITLCPNRVVHSYYRERLTIKLHCTQWVTTVNGMSILLRY